MPKRGEIVDFHLGAFDTEVAIAYGYLTKDTPRTPAVRLYAEHRAYTSWDDVEAHQIDMDDPRITTLGLKAIENAYSDEYLWATQPVRHVLRSIGSFARRAREREAV
jgi:hypothetical protein